MNIAIGKIGRTCLWSKERWKVHAGDEAPSVVYGTLARKYPNDTFYFVGASDLNRLKPNAVVPPNIVDLYHPGHDIAKAKGIEPFEGIIEYMNEKGIHIDLGIFMQGPDGNGIAGQGIRTSKDPNKFNKPLEMGRNYCGNILGVINEYKFPWVNIVEDPRYVPASNRDIFHDEEVELSQINKVVYTNRIPGYGELSKHYRKAKLTYKYAGPERWFMAGLKKYDFSNPDEIHVEDATYKKDNKFILTVNGTKDRFTYIKKWVLSKDPTCKVYGEWKGVDVGPYEDNFELKGISEIEDQMWRTRFTYVPCFTKTLTAFVTQKVWRMIYYGIIPFWDKYSYDTSNIYSMIPDYFKVSSPNEMWEKIDYLCSPEGEEDYKKYLKIYYDLLEDKYFNGDYIVEEVGPYIEKYRPKC